MFVSDVAGFAPDSSLNYTAPSGATITIARNGSTDTVADFLALSSVCPHLGCQVHWEPQNQRFFCPCHNGVFTPEGKAIEGPPKDAGQSLSPYPLKIIRGLLYIEVDISDVACGARWTPETPPGPPGPGHDPCLFRSPAEVA
jgi:Rieske Fe-S protein